MRRILAGIETEYGLLVEGQGAEQQVDNAMALVRDYPGECHIGWDYQYESPRADLRGFRLERLEVDPEDAKFDVGRTYDEAHVVRADRVLPNGARFYNDHGHPEYSTPECWSIFELALQDRAGQIAVLKAGQAYAESQNLEVSLYKNNTDFHGASYGTHESYLVPRAIGFDRLLQDLTPMMIARQILVGAGHLGTKRPNGTGYRLSQRSEYLSELANAETLYRRPIFNTRDEPHASPSDWIRLHVICGDANMIPNATARKVGLMKLAIALCEADSAPLWKFKNPVEAFQSISLDSSYEFRVELAGGSWTNGFEILESYFSAAEQLLELDAEMQWVIDTSRALLVSLRTDFNQFKQEVDWAAKLSILEDFVREEGVEWSDPALASFDLEYHNIDPDSGLYFALEEMGQVQVTHSEADLLACLEGVNEPTRAYARGLAISRFDSHLEGVCWRTITLRDSSGPVEIELRPDREYPPLLATLSDVGMFIEALRGLE